MEEFGWIRVILREIAVVVILVLVAALALKIIKTGKDVIDTNIEIAGCPSSCNGNCLIVEKAGINGNGKMIMLYLEKARIERYGGPSTISIHYLAGDRIYYAGCKSNTSVLEDCKEMNIPLQYFSRFKRFEAYEDEFPEGLMEIGGMYYAVVEDNGEKFLYVFSSDGYVQIPIDGFKKRVIELLSSYASGGGVFTPTKFDECRASNDDSFCCMQGYSSLLVQKYLYENTVFFNLSDEIKSGEIEEIIDTNSFPPEVNIDVIARKNGKKNMAKIKLLYSPVDCLSEEEFKKKVEQAKKNPGRVFISIESKPEFSEKSMIPLYMSHVVDNTAYLYIFYDECDECRSSSCLPEYVENDPELCGCTLNLASGQGECGKNCAVPIRIDYTALARTVLER